MINVPLVAFIVCGLTFALGIVSAFWGSTHKKYNQAILKVWITEQDYTKQISQLNIKLNEIYKRHAQEMMNKDEYIARLEEKLKNV